MNEIEIQGMKYTIDAEGKIGRFSEENKVIILRAQCGCGEFLDNSLTCLKCDRIYGLEINLKEMGKRESPEPTVLYEDDRGTLAEALSDMETEKKEGSKCSR